MSVDPTALENDLGPLRQDLGGESSFGSSHDYVDLSAGAATNESEGDTYFSTFNNFTPLGVEPSSDVQDLSTGGLLGGELGLFGDIHNANNEDIVGVDNDEVDALLGMASHGGAVMEQLQSRGHDSMSDMPNKDLWKNMLEVRGPADVLEWVKRQGGLSDVSLVQSMEPFFVTPATSGERQLLRESAMFICSQSHRRVSITHKLSSNKSNFHPVFQLSDFSRTSEYLQLEFNVGLAPNRGKLLVTVWTATIFDERETYPAATLRAVSKVLGECANSGDESPVRFDPDSPDATGTTHLLARIGFTEIPQQAVVVPPSGPRASVDMLSALLEVEAKIEFEIGPETEQNKLYARQLGHEIIWDCLLGNLSLASDATHYLPDPPTPAREEARGKKRKKSEMWDLPVRYSEIRDDTALPCGICNRGNTCYMASVVHSLFFVPSFREAILCFTDAEQSVASSTGRSEVAIKFTAALRNLFGALVVSNRRAVDPGAMYMLLTEYITPGAEVPAISWLEQEDPSLLCDVLLKENSPIKAAFGAERFDAITRMFEGRLAAEEVQMTDGRIISDDQNLGRERFLYLNLQQEKERGLGWAGYDSSASTGIYDSLATHFGWVEYKSSEKGQHQRRRRLQNAPPVLLVQLPTVCRKNRFWFDTTLCLDPFFRRETTPAEGGVKDSGSLKDFIELERKVLKIDEQITSGTRRGLGKGKGKGKDVPEGFRAPEDALANERNELLKAHSESLMRGKREVYTLHSIIMYRADTAISGHYWCYIHDQSNDWWYEINDDQVVKISLPSEVETMLLSAQGGSDSEPVVRAHSLIWVKVESESSGDFGRADRAYLSTGPEGVDLTDLFSNSEAQVMVEL